MGFYEYQKSDNAMCMNNDYNRKIYEAGAASRQPEIDELNFKLAEMKLRLNDAYTDGQASMYKTKQAEVDSLHKNIDALHVEIERIQKEYQMMFEGIQGRQNTIDELKAELKIMQEMHDATCLYVGGLFNERDELQKRIDKALHFFELLNDYNSVGFMRKSMVEILKGESNE